MLGHVAFVDLQHVVVDVEHRGGHRDPGTPSASNCMADIKPVASSMRTWSTETVRSAPTRVEPLRRCPAEQRAGKTVDHRRSRVWAGWHCQGSPSQRKLWWPVHARGKRLVTLDLRSTAEAGTL